jgi:hypothetical protein
MTVIMATVTNAAREYWPKMFGGLATFRPIIKFKVGEGGWIDSSGGAIPRTPDPTLTDLDCIQNPSRYPVDSRAYFEKALVGGDITFVSPSTLRVEVGLTALEFNDDGLGNSPEIWEIGLYSLDQPGTGLTMVAYGTFQKEIKTPVSLTNVVRIVF